MDSGGKEQNYWPGFVDVLSNVVLTLVFVLVVFVIALSLSANKVEKKLQDIIEQKKVIEQQQQAQVTPAKQAAPVANEDVVIDSAEASRFLDDSARTQADIVKSAGKLVINYSASGVDLDDGSSQKLVDALVEIRKSPSQKIIINSYLGGEAYSVAQRLAYYRALYVRKFLIDKGFTTGDKINSRILQPLNASESKNAGHVEILLEGH